MSWMTISALDESGEPCDAFVARATAPRNGEWFDYEGRRLQRIPSRPHTRVKAYEFKGYQLARKDAAKAQGRTLAPRYDDKGVAVFTSRREMAEYTAAHNDNPNNRTHLEWDPDGNE